MSISFRTATPADEYNVVRVWQACDLIRPWNNPGTDFRSSVSTANASVIVATTADEIVGTVMAGYDGHRGWIYYLGVRPELRGQGIAVALLVEAEAWLAALGCPKVELMVRDGNPAHEFYERLGWNREPVSVFSRWLI